MHSNNINYGQKVHEKDEGSFPQWQKLEQKMTILLHYTWGLCCIGLSMSVKCEYVSRRLNFHNSNFRISGLN